MRPLYLIALAGASVAVVAFWVQQIAAFDVPAGLLLLAWLAAFGAAVWASGRDHAGALKWCAGKWTWDSRGVSRSGNLTVLVDLQRVLVVVARCDDGAVAWLCLHRDAEPFLWPALRRALVSTSGHGGPTHEDRADAGMPP